MAQSKDNPFVRQYKYYRLLEVSRDATQEEIKRAYFKLARELHPDVNPDPKAHKKFIKVTEAYEVISNPTLRDIYDSSPAECPICWTHEVIQTTESQYRCRHCWCLFNAYRVVQTIPTVERVTISEKLRKLAVLFQSTQCSWCSKFYTTPFLCPYDRLQSSCVSFDGLSSQERERLVQDEKWWWRMTDMLRHVEDRGTMSRCREKDCLALNPNPQAISCWRCHRHSLSCPKDGTILRYNIERDIWKCTTAGHSQEFAFVHSEPQEEWTAKDKEQWIEGFRKKWEKRKQKEKEEQEKSTQRQREERERENERKDREKAVEDRRRGEEEKQESRNQAEFARKAREEFRIKRQKEQEERRHGQQPKEKKAVESNLYFADGHIEPQDDYPFDPDHVGYYKGEWERKHASIIKRLSEFIVWLFKKLR